MKVSKEFRWEMGHRLMKHEGLCLNLHGHSYKLRLTLEGEKNGDGMLVDFFELDNIINPMIEELDHSFALNAADNEVIEFMEKIGSKYVTFEGDPTVENLAEYFLEKIADAGLPENIKKIETRVYETPDSYASSESRTN